MSEDAPTLGESMYLARLTELANLHSSNMRHDSDRTPGLVVLRRDAPSTIEATMYEPVLCVILQGSKVTSVGHQTAELGPGDALLVSHALPVVSRITKASKAEPYIAVILPIDVQLVHSLDIDLADAPRAESAARPLSAGPADASWLAPLVRYVEMFGNRMDLKILGPATRREIYYRLLLSPLGGMLRTLVVADSHASRITKAIHLLRSKFRVPLRVPELAKSAAMSASSFHEHFKAITGRTPLQYQKDLRLIEAHTLLTAMSHTVSEVAYAVGYESPSHFSRDYRRRYGVPPSSGGAV
jgi:AraC-like DNA-binding protein